MPIKGLKVFRTNYEKSFAKGKPSMFLGGNFITDAVVRGIADILVNNTSLRSLDLDRNFITEKGARYLASALCGNTTLRWLSLSSNNISDEGAHHFADALRSNASLETLILSFNKISDEGVHDIANALRSNTALKNLDVSGRCISAVGACDLAYALCSNTTLWKLEGVKLSPFAVHIFGLEKEYLDESNFNILEEYRRRTSERMRRERNVLHVRVEAKSDITEIGRFNASDDQPKAAICGGICGVEGDNAEVRRIQHYEEEVAEANEKVESQRGVMEMADMAADVKSMKLFAMQSQAMTQSYMSLSSQIMAHSKLLDQLVGQQALSPRLIWLYPKKRSLRNWLSAPSDVLFNNALMLVVVCPETLRTVPCGPSGLGWEVKNPTKWLKDWGPAILLGLQALNLALSAGRALGIPLPTLPVNQLKDAVSFTSNESSGGLFDNYSDVLARNALNSMWSALASFSIQNSLAWGKEATAGGLKNDLENINLVENSIVKLSGDAYNSIEAFLTTGENAQLGSLRVQLEGKMERIWGEDGAMDWVSVEGKEAWYKRHKIKQVGANEPGELLQIEKVDQQIDGPANRLFIPMTHQSGLAVEKEKTHSFSWLKGALKEESGVTERQINLYESILKRNDIYSKCDLERVTLDQFQQYIIDKHRVELDTIGLIVKFKALHARVRNDATVQSSNTYQQLEVRRQMDSCDVASAKQLAKLQKDLAETKRMLHAVFQSSFVGAGSQVQEVVSSREGATVRVVNPQTEEQFEALQLTIMQLQEEIGGVREEMERQVAGSCTSYY